MNRPYPKIDLHAGRRRRVLIGTASHAMEQLEHRVLLSNTWTVVSTADDGSPGTLRYYVNNSAAGDLIEFDPSVFTPGSLHTITLNGQMEISHDLSIEGANVVAVSGNNASRVFQVDAGATAVLSDLTITQGVVTTAGGAGISNNGNLTLNNCVVSKNVAASSAGGQQIDGGGIYNAGTLTITNSSITANQTYSNVDGHGGGGVFNVGLVTINNSTFSSNTAVNGNGGAIANSGTGSLTLTNSTFTQDSAAHSGGAVYNFGGTLSSGGCTFDANVGAGGALSVEGGTATVAGATFSRNRGGNGGAVNSDLGTLTISRSTFTGNIADGEFGGGIYSGHDINFGSETAVLIVSDSSFISNTGDQGGGGIYNLSTATATNCTFSGNGGTEGGGIDNVGEFTITNCTLAGNSVNSSRGGGLNVALGTVTLNNSIVAKNQSVQANHPVPNDISGNVSGSSNLIGPGGAGGLINGVNGNIVGVANPGLSPLGNYGGPTPTVAPLAGSPAIDAGSNALAVDAQSNPLTSDQRGLPRINNGTVDIGAYEVQSSFVVNTVADESSGGDGNLSLREAVNIANLDQGPETVTISFDPTVFAAGTLHTISLTLGQLELAARPGQTTIAGPGAGTLAISGNRTSRVFYMDSQSTDEIDQLEVTQGHGPDGASGVSTSGYNGSAGANGGGIYMSGGNLTLNSVVISGNTAGNGGAGGSGNFASTGNNGMGGGGGSGGGIYVAAGTLTLNGDTLDLNTSGNGGNGGFNNDVLGAAGAGGPSGDGGAIYMAAGAVTVTSCNVNSNTCGAGGRGGDGDGEGSAAEGGAGGNGGAIYAAAGGVSVNASTFNNNTAGNAGVGGQDYYGSYRVGSPGGSGGAIYLLGASLTLNGSTLGNNIAGNGANGASDAYGNQRRGSAGGSGGVGGAFDIGTGDASVTASTITGNSGGRGGDGAENFFGGTGGAGGAGGAFYLDSGSLSITGSSLSLNLAGQGGSGAIGGNANDNTYSGTGGTGGSGGSGAGVFSNQGSVLISNSTLSGNATGSGGPGGPGNTPQGTGGDGGAGGMGGGLFAGAGNVVLDGDTFSGNRASAGGAAGTGGQSEPPATAGVPGSGGAFAAIGANAQSIQCTFTANSAGIGGGIFVATGNVLLVNSTVVANSMSGISIATTGNLALYNTIVAQNTSADIVGAVDAHPSTGETPSSSNLIGTGGSGGLTNGAYGNIVGIVDAGLAPLGSYGGSTQTMPPLPGSPAVNAGSNGLAVDSTGTALGVDQRGLTRICGGTVDIGACELQPLGAPSSIQAVGAVDQITVVWTTVSNASSYNIYRGTSSGGEGTVPLAVGLTAIRFTDSTVTAGSSYFYQVTAVDAAGEGARSVEASAAAVPPVVNASAGVTLVRDRDQQHIDWMIDGSTTGQMLITDPAGLTINGLSNNVTVNLNYTNGDPLPRTLHLNGRFTINGLSGTNPLAGMTLDIGRSTVFLGYTDVDPIAAIKEYLQAGYNGGGWSGTPTATTGVITSLAAQANPNHNTAIGYADSSDGQGVNTMPNTIELTYTLYGDANLDHQVNSADLQILLFNLNRPGSWDQGDFNYDTQVNSADLQRLLFTLNTNLGNQASPAVAAGTNATIVSGAANDPGGENSRTQLPPVHVAGPTVPVNPPVHHATTLARKRRQRGSGK